MKNPKFVLIPPQPEAPYLKTRIPGPIAKAMVAKDEKVTSPSYTRDYELVIDNAIGSVVTDPDGNRFLDMTAGIAVTSTGHSHPYVVDAIKKQAEKFLHMSGTDFYYAPQIELATKLAKIAPMKGKNRVFFTNSGAEAIEAAFKLSRHHTGRQHIIAFWGAFHGRTFGAMSLCGSKAIHRRRFMPLVPQITHVTYPNPYRPLGKPGQSPVDFTMNEIENVVFRREVSPEEVAAIFVEPIQGEGGYIVPPADFFPRLRKLCDKYGILLVADEVQSGNGRTGKMWAIQHSGVEPDILATAKGIASGMPLGAMIAREGIMDWPPGAHASTYGGNPLSCVAALATYELLEGGLVKNAEVVGDHLQKKLRKLQKTTACIGDVRGKGLMTCIDLVTDRKSRDYAAKLRNAVVIECFHRGVLILGCGESSIRFCPALTVSKKQIDKTVEIVGGVIKSLCKKY